MAQLIIIIIIMHYIFIALFEVLKDALHHIIKTTKSYTIKITTIIIKTMDKSK